MKDPDLDQFSTLIGLQSIKSNYIVTQPSQFSSVASVSFLPFVSRVKHNTRMHANATVKTNLVKSLIFQYFSVLLLGKCVLSLDFVPLIGVFIRLLAFPKIWNLSSHKMCYYSTFNEFFRIFSVDCTRVVCY